MATNIIQAGGVATFAIQVNGNALADTLSVFSVEVEKKVNCIATAKIVIVDGDPNTGTFDASSSSVFVPGNQVSIEAGYDGTNKVIFTGIITGQNLRIDETGSFLEVVCYDAAIKMTAGKKCLTYSNQTDSEIIKAIIESYAGLTANVQATANQWPCQVQYDVSDWDYILSLAAANGLVITTINSKVSVAAPTNNTAAVCSVSYGDGLMEFNASLNALDQYGQVNASAWDFEGQQIIGQQAIPESDPCPGNLSTKQLSAAMGNDTYSLQTTAPLDAPELTGWSKSQMRKLQFSKITGQAKFAGTSLVEPANYITMAGLGDRFNGDHFISGLIHKLSEGNWFTEVSLGMQVGYSTQQTTGITTAARGLLNGTVQKIADDPEGQYRILVSVPVFDAQGNGIWARLSNFYASSGAGAFFLPEIGDEVLVGFLNEDPRFPVVLGSLYSSTAHQPYSGISATDENRLKAIISRSGLSIQFDDTDKTLSICTPAKNSFVLSDKDKQVTLADENGNSLVMGPQGISITSIKDINIHAVQKINIQGTTGVSMHADGGFVDIKAVTINETADSTYSAQAGASAKLSAGNLLSLEGALIKIN
jgi:phage protein D